MKQLELQSVIGFNGSIADGMLLAGDRETLIYALGSTIVIREKDFCGSQSFLHGHSGQVSCLAMSSSGRYLASGQVAPMGFVAEIILWDLRERCLLHRMELHKAKVQALDFSPDERYLVSLGGQDDNALVLWNVETGTAICGSPTDGRFTFCVKFLEQNSYALVTGGECSLRFWDFDLPNNKLRPADVKLGQLRRIVNCIHIDEEDTYLYCGTTSGDLLQVSIATRLLKRSGPSKKLIAGGITSILCVEQDTVLVGAGDGTARLLHLPESKVEAKYPKAIREVLATKLNSSNMKSSPIRITSMAFEAEENSLLTVLTATDKCEIHRLTLDKLNRSLESELLQTSHSGQINDLVFPHNYSEVFATCGRDDIRLWHVKTSRELLRMVVPNVECNCVCFSRDGCHIYSGWSDGGIRVFKPQSGVLECKRPDAHHKGVMSVACSNENNPIISGGEDGTVRVWCLIDKRLELIASMKEHKASVTSISVNPAMVDECTSCSEDGSCVIWDLTSFHRRNSLFENTCFRAVEYHPDGSQLITSGTDRKITYWDPFDGQAIRTIDGSDSEPVNALGIDVQGEIFVSGGGDSILKQWNYEEGLCYHQAQGHSGAITKVKVTPARDKIISVGTEGGIYIWNYPSTQ